MRIGTGRSRTCETGVGSSGGIESEEKVFGRFRSVNLKKIEESVRF